MKESPGGEMKEGVDRLVPHARKDGLVVQELQDEVLVYDLERHKAHCLNHTAAWIWKHCDGQTTVSELARLLQTELQAPVGGDVTWFALEQLGRYHLLSDRVSRPAATVGLSRREMVKQLGLAAMIGLPLVTSIVAPTATQAATCIPPGGNCQNVSVPCCSGNCNGPVCQ